MSGPSLAIRRLRLRRGIEKSWPDLRILLAGHAPPFVYGSREVRALPVFVLHRVDDTLEKDLARLASCGFRTVGASEIESFSHSGRKPDPSAIAITFDDGDVSLVKTAVPLLEKYGFRALAFVVPGLVPPSSTEELAGWSELREAVKRGVLEVGSHSLFHHHVPVSPRILDFAGPSTDTRFTANLPIPRARGDEAAPPGSPIHPGAPRYALQPAFLPDPEMKERCVALAREEGPDFFRSRGWRARLREAAGKFGGHRESAAEMEAAVVADIAESLRMVAEHCPNPAQSHLCYPWFVGRGPVDRWAAGAGARVLHKGIAVRDHPFNGTASSANPSGASPAHVSPGLPAPPAIRRLPPDFLGRLPGPGRRPLRELASRRLRAIVSGPG